MKTSLQLHASVESKTMFRPTPWCPSTSFVFAVDVSNGGMAKEKKRICGCILTNFCFWLSFTERFDEHFLWSNFMDSCGA